MKRLLEWKQKMLQSPLNRKVHQSRGFIRNDYYKSHDEYGQRMPHNIYPGNRKAANMVSQYSSYSSDDEGKQFLCKLFIKHFVFQLKRLN